MQLEKKVFGSSRLVDDDDYQYVGVELNCESGKGHVRVDLTGINRWRSIDDTAAYLRWAAEEIEKIEVIDCPFL